MWENLPIEIIHTIINLRGSVVYINGKYKNINKINKSKFAFIDAILNKKKNIEMVSSNLNFYFKFHFEKLPHLGFYYDYGFIEPNTLKIGFLNFNDPF